MAIIHDGNSVPISSGNPLPTQLSGSDVQIPVDIQGRYATTIQTHVGVMIAPSGNNGSAWVDTNGFSEVAFTFKNDASTTSHADVGWSHDGVTAHSGDFAALASSSAINKTFITPTKARYFKTTLINGDAAAPHTMSGWVYLKA